MARKALTHLSRVADAIAQGKGSSARKGKYPTAPALGALQGTLNAIKDIDPDLIDDWGPPDRLEELTDTSLDESGDYDSLKQSIVTSGQHVPIMVRESGDQERYEVIYGRRRLRACRELGITVRANVQNLDDATAILAKGLENAARRNLSFYERARFAAEVMTFGHDTSTAMQVLNVSSSGLSHFTKVTRNVPDRLGNHIGPAPRSGRERWTKLADLFKMNVISEDDAMQILETVNANASSDDRLDLLLKTFAKKGSVPQGTVHTLVPVKDVRLASTRAHVTLSVRKTGSNAAFALWLEDNLSRRIQTPLKGFRAVHSQKERTNQEKGADETR